jgi:MFS family permease
MIACGWSVYSVVYFGFALAPGPGTVWLLYAVYGLFYALTEGSAKALVAELVPDESRGRAFGLYNTSVGVLALPASLIAGVLWTRVSASAPFFFGGAVALLSIAGLVAWSRPAARLGGTSPS